MTARHLAVVDVETTGLGNNDRVVEVAVVTVDASTGDVVDEFDSLVNPMRDVGPVHVHGVTPSMVSAAPTFDELAAAIESRLTGAVLVAHNLSFDARMLTNEFDRLGAVLDKGEGVCTLRLSGQRLNLACETFDIELGHHHRALADARATAELYRRIAHDPSLDAPAFVTGLDVELNPRTLRREAAGSSDDGVLHRVVSRLRYPAATGALVSYLDMLDWALDDLVVTDAERRDLDVASIALGLTSAQLDDAHRGYLEALIAAAHRDGVITPDEHRLIGRVADLLGVTGVSLPEATPADRSSGRLRAGLVVCFTGTAVVDGQLLTRADLEQMAESARLTRASSVTRNVDVVVAADPHSMSRKVTKARQYGISVISVDQFVDDLRRRR